MIVKGITSIEFGDIAVDGGVATTFAALGRTRRDTFSFNPTDAQTTNIEVEEQDDPIDIIVNTPASLSMQWSQVDWDTDVLEEIWGGATVNGQWQAPDQEATVEKSLKVTPQTGNAFTFPRVKLTAVPQYDTTGKMFQLQITAQRLQPEKAGTPKMMWG